MPDSTGTAQAEARQVIFVHAILAQFKRQEPSREKLTLRE